MVNSKKLEKLIEVAEKVNISFTEAHFLFLASMKELLAPYGKKGVYLNEHIDEAYSPMCEITPKTFNEITALRYYNGNLQMQIADNAEWIDFSMACDTHFLWNELVEALEFLYDEENLEFEGEMFDFKKVWSEYGSFNELLGCARGHCHNTSLVLDVDEYNNNVIACCIAYGDRLEVEFTYVHMGEKPFEITKVKFDGKYVPYDKYKAHI
jgi:hypothetical protein